MADQNSIKTIMSIDNSDVTEKLKQLKTYYEATFTGWIEATDKLKSKDKELIQAKGDLVNATRALKEEQANGDKANKADIEALKQIVKNTKDKIQVLGLEKKAIQANTQATESEITVTRKLQAELSKLSSVKNQSAQDNTKVTQTLEEENIALKKVYDSLYTNVAAQEAYNAKMGQLNSMRDRGVISQTQYNDAIAKEKLALQGTVAERDSQFNHFIRMARWGGTLIGVYYALSTAWRMTIGTGLEVAAQFEQMQIGIASLVATNSQNVDSTGKVITATEKFAMSQQGAADAIKMLRLANIDTPATLEQLTRGFQSALGPAESLGFTLKQTVEYSRLMTLAASALTVPMEQLQQEMRSVLNGTIDQNSIVANSLGITNEQIKAHNKLGDTYSFLISKLKDFESAGTAVNSSWQGITSNLSDAWRAFLADVAKSTGVFDAVKAGMVSLTKALKDLNSESDGVKRKNDWLIPAEKTLYATMLGGPTAGILEYKRQLSEAEAAIARASGKKMFEADIKGLSGESANDQLSTIVKRSRAVYDEEIALLAEYKKRKGLMYESDANSEEQKNRKRRIAALDAEQKDLVAYSSSLKKKKAELQANGANGTITPNQILELQKLNQTYTTPEDKHIKDLVAAKEILKAAQKSLDIHTKSKAITEQEKRIKEDILSADKLRLANANAAVKAVQAEIDKTNASEASKALTEQHKADRQELSDLEMLKAHYAALSATKEAEQAQEAIKNVDIQKLGLTELQKIKVDSFDAAQELLQKELEADGKLNNSKNAQYKTDQDTAKLKENVIQRAEYILKLVQAQTAEVDKQNRLLGQQANIELQDDLRALTNASKRDKTDTPMARAFGKNALSPSEASKLIQDARDWTDLETFGIVDEKAIASAEEKLTKFTEEIKNRIAEIPDVTLDIKLVGFDDTTKAFAGLVNSFYDMNKANNIYNTQLKVSAERIQELKNNGKDYTEEERKRNALISKNATDTISSYGDMIGAVAGFYDTQSSEAKKLHEVEKVLSAAKMVMQLAEMAQSTAFTGLFVAQEEVKGQTAGATAVAVAAQSSPLTGFATAAAMIAMLASLGIMLGGAFGGGDTVSKDAFSAKAANIGAGTVLGDTTKQSTSIVDSLTTLSDLAKPEFRLLSSMNNSLQNISQNIGGLAARIIEVGGYATGQGFTSSSTASTINLSSNQGTALASLGTVVVSDLLKSVIGDNIISNIVDTIGSTIGNLVGSIFGGGKSKSLSDSGLAFNAQYLGDAVSNLSGSSYQTIKTKTSGGWFGHDKTSYNTNFSALDESTRRQFELVLGNLQDITVKSAEALNTSSDSVTKTLSTFVVDLGKISLKGKTGKEIEDTLTSIFGAVGDKMAATAFPALVPFQQVGEALFSTMTRVASGMQTADFYISRLGVSFQELAYTDLLNTQGDVALETLRQSILAMEGSSNGVAQIIATFTGTVDDLYATYTGLAKLRTSLTAIGLSTDSLTSSMLYGAGGIDALTTATSDYVTNFLTASQKLAVQTATVKDEFAALGLAMPTSNDEFVKLVNSIDTTTEAGQKLFGAVMLTAKDFSGLTSDISSNITNLTGAAQSLADALAGLSNSIDSTITALRNGMTGAGGSSVSQQDLITRFWEDKTKAQDLIALNGDLTPKQQSTLSTLVGDLNILSTQIQGAQVGNNVSMSNSLIGQLQDLQMGINSNENIVQSAIVNAQGKTIDVATEGTLTQLVKAVTESNTALGIDGSHADGLRSVPFDGYIAELHKGERVLTANEALSMNSGGLGGILIRFDTSAIERINTRIYDKITSVYNILNEAQIGSRPLFMKAV